MSRPVVAVPQQGITRRLNESEEGRLVCQLCQFCQSRRRLATICDTGSCDEFFERVTDGGVARTTPHCTAPHAGYALFISCWLIWTRTPRGACPITGKSHQLVPSPHKHKYNATSATGPSRPEKGRPLPKNCCLEFLDATIYYVARQCIKLVLQITIRCDQCKCECERT